jgi:uncharacterized membrane protein
VAAINVIIGCGHVLTGVLCILISIPLLKERVKMNRFYGIRLKKSFQSEESWYRMNRQGARILMRWSAGLIIFGILLMFVRLDSYPPLLILAALAPLFFLSAAAFEIYRYSKTC